MRKSSILLALFAVLTSCETNEIPGSNNGKEPAEQTRIKVDVQEDKLAAFSVTFDILPDDKEALYYYDIISKPRLTEVDVATIKTEIIEAAEMKAGMSGLTVEQELATLLSKGDQLNILSNAGYRPNTDFCIYAFYWEDSTEELSLCEFRTPAKQDSSESVELNVTTATYSMVVEVEPTEGVTEYWYYLGERTKTEAMLAGLEDENAYMSYQAMNVGSRKQGTTQTEHKGLKPNTEYMVLVMGIDEQLNRFVVSEIFTTLEEEVQQRVESELFDKLLGEWSGQQTISDLFAEPIENNFTVNILSEIEDVDYDYRAMNQLVATVDGWCNIGYYSVTALAEMDIEEPEDKWGPKWVLNIAEGDVVTIDGKAQGATVGWMFLGDCFTLNMKADGSLVDTDTDLEVDVSADYNTITIRSPKSMANTYPGLGYNFEGFGWMGYYYGLTDIVLTRK